MSEHTQVLYTVGLGLKVGQSLRIICRFCRASHERSLCVTRTESAILYVCPRAKCGARGRIPLTSADIVRTQKPIPLGLVRPEVYYKGSTTCIPDALSSWLYEQYEVTPDGWLYEPQYHRLIMPARDYDGIIYGVVAKRLPDIPGVGVMSWHGPKVTNYMSVARGHFIHPNPERDLIVITEDIISARKVGSMACALLGTHISKDLGQYLVESCTNWLLMLDPDAAGKARRIKEAYSPRVRGSIYIVTLPRDPKDMPGPVLGEIVTAACTYSRWPEAVSSL